MKRFIIITSLLLYVAISVFAQTSRTKKIERYDGFVWFKVESTNKNGETLYGAEDEKGKTIVPVQYDDIFYNIGHLHARKDVDKHSLFSPTYEALYTKEGRCVISVDRHYENCAVMDDNLWVSTQVIKSHTQTSNTEYEGGIKNGACDYKTGREILPPIYDDVKYDKKTRKFQVKDVSGWHVADVNIKLPQLPYDYIKIKYSDGSTYVGRLKNDLPEGEGDWYYKDGSRYSGNFENGIPSGFGKFVDKDGIVYIGSWKNGKRHGNGVVYLTDEIWYEGEFANGNFNGVGILFYSKGRFIEAEWKDNKVVRFITQGNYSEGMDQDKTKPTTNSDSQHSTQHTTTQSFVGTPSFSMPQPMLYNTINVMPMPQLMSMSPYDVGTYCNQFPGNLNVLLDPRFAVMQVQQQMQAQQAFANQQMLQMQKTWDNMMSECIRRVDEERSRFVSDYMKFNPGSSINDAQTAYGNYVNGLSQIRNETYNNQSVSEPLKYNNESKVKKVGETIEYVTVGSTSRKEYCEKCKDYMLPHYHKPLNIVSW